MTTLAILFVALLESIAFVRFTAFVKSNLNCHFPGFPAKTSPQLPPALPKHRSITELRTLKTAMLAVTLSKRLPVTLQATQLSKPVATQPQRQQQLDPTIIKALVRKGFRVEQIEALWQSGRLTIV